MKQRLVRTLRQVGAAVLASAVIALVLPGTGFGQPVAAPPAYTLGPEDVIQVLVLGRPELTQTVQIGPDGRASLFYVGSVYLTGMTTDQVARMLMKTYADYLVNPQVSVSVTKFRAMRVALIGQVTRPGIVEIPPGAHLVEAVATAGGLTPGADLGKARLQHADGTAVPIDLTQALQGNAEQNPVLRPGDAVIVPGMPEESTRKFYVFGDVHNPGSFTLAGPLTLLQALATAGGPIGRSIGESNTVYLIRHLGGAGSGSLPAGVSDVTPQEAKTQAAILKIDMHAVRERGDLYTQPGDVLYVPTSLLAETAQILIGLALVFR